MPQNVLIIAEAGVNHNGELSLAKELVKAAALAGADYVKFQTFNAELLANSAAKKANYQLEKTSSSESQYEMLKNLELSEADHIALINLCDELDIQFLSSPFDMESIDLLVKLNMAAIKIPSGEITNLPYLEKTGALNLQIILSSGMADLEELATAFRILVESGTEKKNIILLQCTSQYPAEYRNINLLAMQNIRDRIHPQVGFSDHSIGDEVSIAAVALGAMVIEKHFTLDKNLPGPDHSFSLNPEELETMIRKIRNVESALGSSNKIPNNAELENKPYVRKSIHFNQDLPKGTILNKEHFIMQRPGTGISPMEINTLVGKKTTQDFKKFDLISFADLE